MNKLPTTSQTSVAILGAGIGGMAAAYDLAKAGRKVTIFEAAEAPGGLAGGFKEPGWDWWVDKYYHHWFASDRYMLELIAELGWQADVIFKRPFTVMYHEGRFYPFDSILTAILFPGLGWGLNKLRFGMVGLFLKLTNDWQSLEQYTAHEWMRRWAGRKVYELMWEPLLMGKFGRHYQAVNMAWLWARIKSRTTNLGTFRGGFQAFANRFAERLTEMGVEIQYNTPVSGIRSENGQVRLELPDGPRCYDQALATTSPGLLSRLAPDLSGDYLRDLLGLKSMGAVVMTISLKQPLSKEGYYWYSLPKSAGFPFLALVEHTNFVPSENFGGENLIYCGDYLDTDHEYFRLSKEELLKRFLPAFSRFNPDFKPDWVNQAWLYKTAYAQPIPGVNHSRHIPDLRTPLPGLYFASMSQVYPWDRGTNFAVEIGRRAAGLMLADQVPSAA